jgi:hypothetical protein
MQWLGVAAAPVSHALLVSSRADVSPLVASLRAALCVETTARATHAATSLRGEDGVGAALALLRDELRREGGVGCGAGGGGGRAGASGGGEASEGGGRGRGGGGGGGCGAAAGGAGTGGVFGGERGEGEEAGPAAERRGAGSTEVATVHISTAEVEFDALAGSESEAMHVYGEVWRDDVYLRHGVRVPASDGTVVDVGANIGLFVLRVLAAVGTLALTLAKKEWSLTACGAGLPGWACGYVRQPRHLPPRGECYA